MKSARQKKIKTSSTGRTSKARLAAKAPIAKPAKPSEKQKDTLQNWLQLAHLRWEKCELDEAKIAFTLALEQAKKQGDLRATMEAIAGLLRLAGEALDMAAISRWDEELDALMASNPRQIPPMAWYCKGVVARANNEPKHSQKFTLRYIRALRKDPGNGSWLGSVSAEEAMVKGWTMLALALWMRKHGRRALLLAQTLLARYEAKNFRGLNGILYLLVGNIAEKERDLEKALRFYQKAHMSFLGEHNWYYHLYVLYGYARIARLQRNYVQAYWYLDLMEKATSSPDLGLLRREVTIERTRLEQDAVDLLIDSRQGVIKTRESGKISLRKQYVLLHILEALSNAHGRPGSDTDRGLSKSEIIEYVWKEAYRPEAHDNKLYYNINRLRKLIEPDVRKPQYLLNWKEGYRLAPGLRVQFVGLQKERGGEA